ncbi:MAG: high-potential iron-sulfur protein [Pseudomonadota bacterium]|nr:high-potential iron-sulfur protein [Pseudomonadota bacterium]
MSHDNKRNISLSRRGFLSGMARVAVAGSAVLLASCGRDGNAIACVENLASGEASLRRSFNYSDKSPVADKSCGNCVFFEAGEGGCGHCRIFTGPASLGGYCDSWSKRA